MLAISENDNRVVKASFKDCSIEDRNRFSKSRCIMPISVGQKVHEGAKFIATLNLINRSFQHCDILIDDSIQRYTYMIGTGLSEEKAYGQAITEGDSWIDRNIQFYSKLTISHRIIRWDDWTSMKMYQFFNKQIIDLYNNNLTYQTAFNQNIHLFLERFKANSDLVFNYDEAYSLCQRYLLEECSVMCLWAEQGYDFEVYPNGRNNAMAATFEFLISQAYPNKLHSVSLRFKKYSKAVSFDMT